MDRDQRQKRANRLLVLLVGLAVVLPSLWNHDLWAPDEPRYAQVAREMRVGGDYLVPHLNGEPYAQKPPLFFWLSAAVQSLGPTYIGGRIVAGVALIGTLLLILELAGFWLPDRTAWLAPLILASFVLFTGIGKSGVIDVPLTFLTTLSFYGLVRSRSGSVTGSALFYAGMGLAVLMKGPVAVLILVLGVIALRSAGKGEHGQDPRRLVWGALLVAVIVGAWLLPALLQGGPAYAEVLLFKQNVGRLAQAWSHPKPWYYYLVRAPLLFFPWSLLVPFALFGVWKARADGGRPSSRALAIWFLLGFAVFSLISGKRERYLLPLYPVLALTLAVWLDRALLSESAARWPRVLLRIQTAAALFVSLVLVALGIAGPHALYGLADSLTGLASGSREALLSNVSRGLWVCGLASAPLAAAALWTMRRRAKLGLALLACWTFATFVSADLGLIPALNPVLSPAMLAREIPPDLHLASYPENFSGSYNIYSGRTHIPVLKHGKDVERFLRAGDRAVLTTLEDYREIVPDLSLPYGTTERQVGHRHMLLVWSDGLPAPGPVLASARAGAASADPAEPGLFPEPDPSLEQEPARRAPSPPDPDSTVGTP